MPSMPVNYGRHPSDSSSMQFPSSRSTHKTHPSHPSQRVSDHRNGMDDKQIVDSSKDGNGDKNACEYVNESNGLQINKSCSK